MRKYSYVCRVIAKALYVIGLQLILIQMANKKYTVEEVAGLFKEYEGKYVDAMSVDEFLKQKGIIKMEFKKYELYTHTSGTIIKYQGGTSGYGVGADGEWIDLANTFNFIYYPERWSKSTDSDKVRFSNAFLDEVHRKGFKMGLVVNQKTLNHEHVNHERTISAGSCRWVKGSFYLFGAMIFHNGSWAEIIEEKEEFLIQVTKGTIIIEGKEYTPEEVVKKFR